MNAQIVTVAIGAFSALAVLDFLEMAPNQLRIFCFTNVYVVFGAVIAVAGAYYYYYYEDQHENEVPPDPDYEPERPEPPPPAPRVYRDVDGGHCLECREIFEIPEDKIPLDCSHGVHRACEDEYREQNNDTLDCAICVNE